jgi:hypothetical protein
MNSLACSGIARPNSGAAAPYLVGLGIAAFGPTIPFPVNRGALGRDHHRILDGSGNGRQGTRGGPALTKSSVILGRVRRQPFRPQLTRISSRNGKGTILAIFIQGALCSV